MSIRVIRAKDDRKQSQFLNIVMQMTMQDHYIIFGLVDANKGFRFSKRWQVASVTMLL